jgi:hypothetical protein
MPPIAARPIRVARRSRLSLLHRVTTRSASRLGGCVSSRSVRFRPVLQIRSRLTIRRDGSPTT